MAGISRITVEQVLETISDDEMDIEMDVEVGNDSDSSDDEATGDISESSKMMKMRVVKVRAMRQMVMEVQQQVEGVQWDNGEVEVGEMVPVVIVEAVEGVV